MKLSFLRIGWGVTAVVLLALAPGVARAHKVVEVHTNGNSFVPEFVEIELGDTVRWVFDPGVQHSTTSVDGEWDSGLIQDAVFEYTFQGTGQYDYFCTLHVDCCNMVGSVYVLDRSNVVVKPKNSLQGNSSR